MNLSKQNISDIGSVVKDVIVAMVPSIVRQETGDIRQDIHNIHQNIDALRENTNDLRYAQSNQAMQLSGMRHDVNQLKELARKQGILYEDLNYRFMTVAELLQDNLAVENRVGALENRMDEAESIQDLLKRTVKTHSRQLKTI